MLTGADRNMYDRLVHFCFGLLLAYPVREVFVRITRARGVWGYWLPVELTLAFSAIYELIEWGAAKVVDPAAGLAFLGSQGDIWDAQKDMALAGLGSVITMLLVLGVHLWYRRADTWRELIQSMHIPKEDSPLGEVALRKLARSR
jgi:putative membrane protein